MTRFFQLPAKPTAVKPVAVLAAAALMAMALPIQAHAVPPHASPYMENFEASFPYNPATDAKTTYKRFKRIADRACRVDDVRVASSRALAKACRDDILAKAVMRTKNAELASLHSGKTVSPMTSTRAKTAVLSSQAGKTASDCAGSKTLQN